MITSLKKQPIWVNREWCLGFASTRIWPCYHFYRSNILTERSEMNTSNVHPCAFVPVSFYRDDFCWSWWYAEHWSQLVSSNEKGYCNNEPFIAFLNFSQFVSVFRPGMDPSEEILLTVLSFCELNLTRFPNNKTFDFFLPLFCSSPLSFKWRQLIVWSWLNDKEMSLFHVPLTTVT